MSCFGALFFFFFFFSTDNRFRFFQQIANSRSGCADAQAHIGIRCSHVALGQFC